MTTHAAWSYYTTKATEYYMTTYAAHPTTPKLPSITLFSDTYCTCFPNYYSVPCCYTEVPAYYSTKTVEYYTEAPKYYSAPIYTTTTEAAKYYAVPTYFTEAALSYYIERKYYSDAPFYFTTTYATPSYNTAVPKYYTGKAAHYTTTCLVYHIEEFKYYPAPNYYHLRFICIKPGNSPDYVTTT
jgi:hypothetical protein